MSAPAPDPDGLPIDIPALLSHLGELHAHQLTEANLEAAKWRTAAQGAATELATLRARVAVLETTQGGQNGALHGGVPASAHQFE